MNTITVRLNGTDTNPWSRMGFTQNPFPQMARAELSQADRALSSLDGEPLKGVDDIRARLNGVASDEFIELCCLQFKPGKRVVFTATWRS